MVDDRFSRSHAPAWERNYETLSVSWNSIKNNFMTTQECRAIVFLRRNVGTSNGAFHAPYRLIISHNL